MNMKYPFHLVFFHILTSVVADFPLEDPCLQRCPIIDIRASVLQKCVDRCLENGFCFGNRLAEGACTDTTDRLLSCSNGCEIAFYSTSVGQCKDYCVEGNGSSCKYTHPFISQPFKKCWDCNECETPPHKDACSSGCEYAAEFEEYCRLGGRCC